MKDTCDERLQSTPEKQHAGGAMAWWVRDWLLKHGASSVDPSPLTAVF